MDVHLRVAQFFTIRGLFCFCGFLVSRCWCPLHLQSQCVFDLWYGHHFCVSFLILSGLFLIKCPWRPQPEEVWLFNGDWTFIAYLWFIVKLFGFFKACQLPLDITNVISLAFWVIWTTWGLYASSKWFFSVFQLGNRPFCPCYTVCNCFSFACLEWPKVCINFSYSRFPMACVVIT